MSSIKKVTLAQYATASSEDALTKADRKVVNPVLFATFARTLGAARTWADFEATLTESEWDTYAGLFEGTPARTTRKTGTRKATSKKASKVARTFDCGCMGIRQHLSAKNGCGIAAERKAAKANA